MASETGPRRTPEPDNVISGSDQQNYNQETQTTDDTDINYSQLSRVQTQRSSREVIYDPINAGDREELHRIATSYHNTSSANVSCVSTEMDGLQVGRKIRDPSLDPGSSFFDIYKWIKA